MCNAERQHVFMDEFTSLRGKAETRRLRPSLGERFWMVFAELPADRRQPGEGRIAGETGSRCSPRSGGDTS